MTAERFPAMASTLHAIGTVALGAGIFLAGHIFNLDEHWPGGLMLWTLGAAIAWALPSRPGGTWRTGMMTPLASSTRKGLFVAALHVAIVASLGAKLLIDRATRPRVWARTAPVDPNLPIRGRYVRLNVEAVPSSELRSGGSQPARIELSARDGQLVAAPATGSSTLTARFVDRAGHRVAVLNEPLAYFIPEHIADPSRRAPGEELWVEVTIPRAGAPRPIRLGVKKDGVLTPLEVE